MQVSLRQERHCTATTTVTATLHEPQRRIGDSALGFGNLNASRCRFSQVPETTTYEKLMDRELGAAILVRSFPFRCGSPADDLRGVALTSAKNGQHDETSLAGIVI